jgi:hypothetical protein
MRGAPGPLQERQRAPCQAAGSSPAARCRHGGTEQSTPTPALFRRSTHSGRTTAVGRTAACRMKSLGWKELGPSSHSSPSSSFATVVMLPPTRSRPSVTNTFCSPCCVVSACAGRVGCMQGMSSGCAMQVAWQPQCRDMHMGMGGSQTAPFCLLTRLHS